MAQNIVIYQDEGVGEFGLSCLCDFFKNDHVRLADADAVIRGEVFQEADLFVMPGGADLPYCRKLNGMGNKNIRAFVEQGGTYLGICAGAYYACREIEYHKGRDDEICGPRELAFVDAIAVGSLPELAPWYDNTLKTAAVILVDGQRVFYNGGCTFQVNDPAVEILASYDQLEDMPPAIIKKPIGNGTVILSGVHIEIGKDALATIPNPNEDRQTLARLSANFSQDMTILWKELLGLGQS